MSSDCLFCKVAAGDIPATVVHENEQFIAFRDIDPQAPSHVLVIPREHVSSLNSADDPQRLGELLLFARDVAKTEGVDEAGFRTVINTNEAGGQAVYHLHVHVLGGRAMRWPPG